MNSLPSDFAPLTTDGSHQTAAQIRDTVFDNYEYRCLEASEIDKLRQNGNHSYHWDIVLVADPFEVSCVRDCYFNGLVRIGPMTSERLETNGRFLPVGLYNSTIQSSDIGQNCAIHHATLIDRVLISNNVAISNVGEILTLHGAHFGQGLDPDQSNAPWIKIWNECGGRRILPFDEMQLADACFWARFRDNPELLQRMEAMTRKCTEQAGPYSLIAEHSCILHATQLCNVIVGPGCLIKGASHIENTTISSTVDAPVKLLSGIDLRDCVIGAGTLVDRHSTAHRSLLGRNVQVDFGARIDHSVIGDFSHIECGEVRSAICFPHHAQHHNTGFLIAACLEGQSNIAAGATIGSNHNSRQPDGEIIANRGFWPGLCTSLKHNSRFASFTLIAKGDYPAELNLRMPFSLISNDTLDDSLNLLPAFAFLHNMYSLVRNEQKFHKRSAKSNFFIETDFLAPDTVEEMFQAMALLEEWTARSWFIAHGEDTDSLGDLEIRDKGCSLLLGQNDEVRQLEVKGLHVENSNRFVRVQRPERAYRAFREMIQFYAVKTLLHYMQQEAITSVEVLKETLLPPENDVWVNLGGQLVRSDDLEMLRAGILSGRIGTWQRFHAELQSLRRDYPTHKAAHALSALMRISGFIFEDLEPVFWHIALDRARVIQNRIARLVRESRLKDYESPFRQITYQSSNERNAVLGPIDQDPVIIQAIEDAKAFTECIDIFQNPS